METSKARTISKQMKYDTGLTYYFRLGARCNNTTLRDYAIHKAKTTYKPVILYWFGTCELTDKGPDGFLNLVTNPESRIEQVIRTYQIAKGKILMKNSGATVIFIECPFINIVNWNKIKGHKNPEIFEKEQKDLEHWIRILNSKTRHLNKGTHNSHIASDMLFRLTKRKSKSGKLNKTNNGINYALLKRDGVHPGNIICRLWLQKLKKILNTYA